MQQSVKDQFAEYNIGASNRTWQELIPGRVRRPPPSTPPGSTSTATARTSSNTASRATQRPAAGVPSGSRSAPKQADGQGKGVPPKPQRPRVVVPKTDCPPIRQVTGPSTAGSSSPASSRASPQPSKSTQKPRGSVDHSASSASPGSSVRTQRGQKNRDVLGNGLVESPVTVSLGGVASSPLPKGKIQTGTSVVGSSTKSLVERPAARRPAGSAGHVAQDIKGKPAASVEEASLECRNMPRTVDG